MTQQSGRPRPKGQQRVGLFLPLSHDPIRKRNKIYRKMHDTLVIITKKTNKLTNAIIANGYNRTLL